MLNPLRSVPVMTDGWVDETPERGFAWEAATPGLDLARAVASADLASLSGDARVSLLKALSRLSGWVSVEVARATMAVDEALEAEAASHIRGPRRPARRLGRRGDRRRPARVARDRVGAAVGRRRGDSFAGPTSEPRSPTGG